MKSKQSLLFFFGIVYIFLHSFYASGSELYRPDIHFTPQANWMNDPNGMVYFEGEYHLFYQYYPEDTVWGPMHWGHAVSNDLFHWKDLPIALYPDELGYIFSGSAVIDWRNTSGFGTSEKPAMVAIYTYHDPVGAENKAIDYQTQGIAYSLDKGRSWVKYEGNPVLANPGIIDFRDPKVFWYEPEQKWVMTLAVKDHIAFYASKDLKTWEHMSDFDSPIGAKGGVWECPDLFQLKDDFGENHWVLIVNINPGAPNGGSGTMYFVGEFDGRTFTNLNEKLYWADYGKDNYAGVTWSDIPDEDGRRIFMGWMSNWLYAQSVPTQSWRSAMTVPRTLKLKRCGEDLKLLSTPVAEIETLYERSREKGPIHLKSGDFWSVNAGNVPWEIEFEAESSSSSITNLQWKLGNHAGEHVSISYDSEKAGITINREDSGLVEFNDGFSLESFGPLSGSRDELKVRMIIDRASVEIFVDDGSLVMTEIYFPTKGSFLKLDLKSGTDLKIDDVKIRTLKHTMER